jgi:hypothetical protein
MHKNVNINNKMLSLVFYRVIKAAINAEKKKFCNAGCLYHPIKHIQKKTFYYLIKN